MDHSSVFSACIFGTLAGTVIYRYLKNDTVRVAAIQASSKFCDSVANTEKFDKLIRLAASEGAKFCVLPECAITGYTSQFFDKNWLTSGREKYLKGHFEGFHPDSPGGAETIDGTIVKHFQNLAKELGVYITVPFVEKAKNTKPAPKDDMPSFFPYDANCYYNTIVLVDPRGEIAGHYRKTNLWNYVDFAWCTYGTDLCVVDTEYGKVGLGVCFDCHKVMKEYSGSIWTLLYCIAWVSNDNETTEYWYSNALRDEYLKPYGDYNVVGANWSVDTDPETMPKPWYGAGFSTIYKSHGEKIIMAQSIVGSEILFADIPTKHSKASYSSFRRVIPQETKHVKTETDRMNDIFKSMSLH